MRILIADEIVNNIGKMLLRLIGENIRRHLDTNPALGHVPAEPGQIEPVLAKISLTLTDKANQDGRHADPGPPSRGNETILVVEDEPTVRQLTREILELQGYTVLEAVNGREALEISPPDLHIDLLLTDVIMPGMGGNELAGHFSLAHPLTRVLYMSGYADHALTRRGVPDKGPALLEKPFSPSTLTRKVREVLDWKAA